MPLADSVIVILDFGGGDVDTYQVVIPTPDSVTVLGALQILTTQENVSLITKEYPFGTLVEQIGDRKNGEGGFWLYTVNSAPVPRAVSSCVITYADTITMKFMGQ